MLSLIPPAVNGASAAVVAPTPPSFFRKKLAAGGARRALAVLGSNNVQLNMNMAKSHLATSQEGFMNRWNFNPVKEAPLAPGRYQWAPLYGGSGKLITPTPSGNIAKDPLLLKDITNPVLSSTLVISETTNLNKSSQDEQESNCKVTNSTSGQENEANSETKCKQVLSPSCEILPISNNNATSGSQMCVTDFFRSQKRKNCNQYEDCQPTTSNSPPKKKLRIIH